MAIEPTIFRTRLRVPLAIYVLVFLCFYSPLRPASAQIVRGAPPIPRDTDRATRVVVSDMDKGFSGPGSGSTIGIGVPAPLLVGWPVINAASDSIIVVSVPLL